VREIEDNNGAAAMLFDLLKMNLGDWHQRNIIRTQALIDQQTLTLSATDQLLLRLLEGGRCQPGMSPTLRTRFGLRAEMGYSNI